jgi:hypothetical protein
MATWDNSDFDREASELARVFWAGQGLNGVPLNDLATKVARDHDLNPEQVRRLCRAANTKAFEQKFASLAGEDDRSPSFPLADAEVVVQNLYQAVAHAEVAKTASYEDAYPALADELRPSPAVETEKVAFFDPTEIDQHLSPTRRPEVELQRTEKNAHELSLLKMENDCTWSDELNALHARTRFLDWNHDAFEKNAVALYGGDALPELDSLRQLLKLPPIGEGLAREDVTAKLASLQDRWVGAPDESIHILKRAMDARRTYTEIGEKLAVEEAKLTQLRKQLRRG